MPSVAAAATVLSFTARQPPSTPAQCDLLRGSRHNTAAYSHRERSGCAASSASCSSSDLPASQGFHRQIPRRASVFCRAEGTEDAYVDDINDIELDKQTYQTARAAAYQFPEEYKRSVMAPTRPTPILDSEEVWQMLQESVTDTADSHFKAFFSSSLGGIVTDPALMVMHVDDHMIHRGHGVYEMAAISDGSIYRLPEHLMRLIASAGSIAIDLPMSAPQMMRTVLETAGTACIPNGHVKMWISAGRGGFGLSSGECQSSAFHCMAYSNAAPDLDYTKGWRVKTSPVPVKHDYFASVKSVNYLENVLAMMDANVEGFDTGIWVDKEGFVCGGPTENIAIVTQDDIIVTPPFENAMPGLTITRVMELAPEYIKKGVLENVTGVEQRPISLEEAKAAKEVFLTSTTLLVQGITHWDGDIIADGEVGPVTVSLYAMMKRDRNPSDKQGELMEIPYGHATGMNLNEEDNDDLVGRQFGSASGPYNV